MHDSETDKDSLVDTESAEPVKDLDSRQRRARLPAGWWRFLPKTPRSFGSPARPWSPRGTMSGCGSPSGRDSPTLGGAAHVRWVGLEAHDAECELEWTHSGPERDQLACIVVSSSTEALQARVAFAQEARGLVRRSRLEPSKLDLRARRHGPRRGTRLPRTRWPAPARCRSRSPPTGPASTGSPVGIGRRLVQVARSGSRRPRRGCPGSRSPVSVSMVATTDA